MAIEVFTWSKKLKKVRYLFAFVLFVYLILLSSSLILKYHVTSAEIYKLSNENLIEDGSFEDFNQTAGNCCTNPDIIKDGKVFASQSTDAFLGKYSLNLTSYNQCACINKPFANFINSEKYILSFNYKGDNPRTCLWSQEDKKCLLNENANKSEEWVGFFKIFNFTDKSENVAVYFYTDASGKVKTNLYDDLQVRKLAEISENADFKSYEYYIIKTNTGNKVNGEIISDAVNGEAYYLIKGKPDITLKFPWTELVLIIIIMLIITRLVLKKREAWEFN